MKLNKSELIEGGFFGLSTFILLGLVSIPLAFGCAFLWALTGEGHSKLYRRVGCGLLVFGAIALKLHDIRWLPGILPAFGVLSLGYGIPDKTDAGSFFGRIFFKITGGNNRMSALFTRLSLAALLAIAFAPLPISLSPFCCRSKTERGKLTAEAIDKAGAKWRKSGSQALSRGGAAMDYGLAGF